MHVAINPFMHGVVKPFFNHLGWSTMSKSPGGRAPPESI